MRKPWSISTTVRNPERLRNFLRVLKRLEGRDFDSRSQIGYQIMLIQEKLYKPANMPIGFRRYFDDPDSLIPYEVAEEIFYAQNYEDPPMRGRQSVNPLNKLGFAIARKGSGAIKITELGNSFLAGDYEIGSTFFKSLSKLQFPNPWSTDFTERGGFDIMPFVAVMHLIHKLNSKSEKKGLNKTEFNIFVPTLINANQIDTYVDKILEFRRELHKDNYISNFAGEFYALETIPQKKINNLLDYGDNIMRYFRLTRYFKVSMDPLGYYWSIDLEPTRMVEIEQLLDMYDGKAIQFATLEGYLKYLSDIEKPELPWEKVENLKKVASSVRNIIIDLVGKQDMEVSQEQRNLLAIEIDDLSKERLENYVSELRKLNLEIKIQIEKSQIVGNLSRLGEIINILKDVKKLKKYEPEQFEKLIAEVLRIINDEIVIKPNYPMDDDGEPINHSPGNKPDIECYYQLFKAIFEVTLNTSKLQWVQEGQPVMRHLRDFELQHRDKDTFCVFIAPHIHNDTYSQFWISVKYEYKGLPQRIVPFTTEQFALLLKTLLEYVKQGEKFSHRELHCLYSQIVNETKKLNSFSDWAVYVPKVLKEWQRSKIAHED